MAENHIFPFLWMRGEAEEILREEIGKIAECGIKQSAWKRARMMIFAATVGGMIWIS